MKEAYLYKKLPDKKVQCQNCAHYCVIENGKRSAFAGCGKIKIVGFILWFMASPAPSMLTRLRKKHFFIFTTPMPMIQLKF